MHNEISIQHAIKDMHPGTESERFDKTFKLYENTIDIQNRMISSLQEERDNLRLEILALKSENSTLKAALKIRGQE
jgi:predicted RNase H-like nuclease (RuvC/YqgF family)